MPSSPSVRTSIFTLYQRNTVLVALQHIEMLPLRRFPPSFVHFGFTTVRGTMGNRMFASTFRSGDIPTRTFDAILATQPELRDGEELMDGGELREKAKKALTGVLSREELCVKQVRNKTFVGNGRGLRLAMETASIQEKFDEELGSQRKKIDSLEGEIASLKKEIALLGKKVASQKKEITSQKKEIVLLGKKVASQKKEIVLLGKKVASQKKEITSQKKEIVLLGKKVASQKKEIVLLGKKVASQKKEIVLLGKKVASQKKEITSQKEEITSQKKEINTLKKEVYCLKVSSKGYFLVRDRFISNFNRHILGSRSESDDQIINEGNAAAHWGDVCVDSILYTWRGVPGVPGWPERQDFDTFKTLYGEEPAWPERQDVDTFKELYGVGPELVSKIKHPETINVLNAHAKTVSLKSKRPTTEFCKVFKKIVELLERGSGDGGYPDKLEDAYKSFWKCNEQ